MRKALLFFGMLITVMVFAVGCSSDSSGGKSGKANGSSDGEGNTLVEEAETYGWEEVVPKYDDIFVSGELHIDTNNEIQYYIRIENCNFDEYIKYRDLCKSSGYNKEVYQDDTGFTYDSKKYRVSSGYITDTKQAWIAFEHLEKAELEENSATEIVGSSEDLTSNDTTSEEAETKDLSALIPNPNNVFTAEEISFNNYGDLVTGSVKNANQSEFDIYKQKCKDAGFDIVDYDAEDDSGSLYMGYNNDKTYRVRLFFSKKDNSVEITLETEEN